MKSGNYTGYCDRGYRRGKNNSNRLIDGLVRCSGVAPPIIIPPVPGDSWVDESAALWVDESTEIWATE